MNAKVRATLGLKSKLLERYADQIDGILGCYDRVIITGTLVDVAHPDVLRARLYALNIRCFDLKLFAEPLRDQVRDNAILVARQAGLEIEYLERRGLRKEDRIAEILEKRGRHPGLVHVFSAMESCKCFKPWHDKKTAKTGLKLTGLSGLLVMPRLETFAGFHRRKNMHQAGVASAFFQNLGDAIFLSQPPPFKVFDFQSRLAGHQDRIVTHLITQRFGKQLKIETTDVQRVEPSPQYIRMRHVDQRAGNNHPIVTAENPVDLIGVTFQQLGLETEGRTHFRIHAPISSQPLGSGYAGLGR